MKKGVFELTPRQLALIDNQGKAVLEPVNLKYISAGASQRKKHQAYGHMVQKAVFEVIGSK